MTENVTHKLNLRLSEIEQQINMLEKERAEILTAKSVLKRYINPQSTGVKILPVKASPLNETGPPRPDGIPTLWEMVYDVLQDNGGKASVLYITEEIARRWWPGVKHPQVGPSVYRFAKEGRLKKADAGVFSLPKKEASDQRSEASRAAEEADTSSIETDAEKFRLQ
ncbi:MAG: hypothetical protein AAGB15_02460 [Pseudomonadota bacterium]